MRTTMTLGLVAGILTLPAVGPVLAALPRHRTGWGSFHPELLCANTRPGAAPSVVVIHEISTSLAVLYWATVVDPHSQTAMAFRVFGGFRDSTQEGLASATFYDNNNDEGGPDGGKFRLVVERAEYAPDRRHATLTLDAATSPVNSSLLCWTTFK